MTMALSITFYLSLASRRSTGLMLNIPNLANADHLWYLEYAAVHYYSCFYHPAIKEY